MKKILVIFSALLIAGCANPHGQIGAIPPVSSADNAAIIYILRNEDAYSAYNFTIALDDLNLVALSTNEYTKIKVEKGRHSLGVLCKRGFASRQKHINLEPSKEYYFMTRASIPCAVIEQFSEQQGKEFIKNASFIPMN